MFWVLVRLVMFWVRLVRASVFWVRWIYFGLFLVRWYVLGRGYILVRWLFFW